MEQKEVNRSLPNRRNSRNSPEFLRSPSCRDEKEREKDEVADDDGCFPEAGAMVCVCVCGSRTLGAERKERDGADEVKFKNLKFLISHP